MVAASVDERYARANESNGEPVRRSSPSLSDDAESEQGHECYDACGATPSMRPYGEDPSSPLCDEGADVPASHGARDDAWPVGVSIPSGMPSDEDVDDPTNPDEADVASRSSDDAYATP